MMLKGMSRLRAILAVVSLAIIVTGSLILWFHARDDSRQEILLEDPEPISGHVYISGAVTNPGIYPLLPGDTVEELLRAAGGVTAGAADGRIELRIPAGDETETFQKVDINRAEPWLPPVSPK